MSHTLDARGTRYLSTARPDRAAFLLHVETEEEALEVAAAVVAGESRARVGVGRPARGGGLGRSLLEARAALEAGTGAVASYRDLGSLELLLSLPNAALEAFVDRVLGPVAASGPSSSRSEPSSTRAAAGARRPRAWASIGTRCATGWSGSRSRRDGTPTGPQTGWSSGSPSGPPRRSRRARLAPIRPA